MKDLKRKLDNELKKQELKLNKFDNTISGLKNKTNLKSKNLNNFNKKITEICNEFTDKYGLESIKKTQEDYFSKYLDI